MRWRLTVMAINMSQILSVDTTNHSKRPETRHLIFQEMLSLTQRPLSPLETSLKFRIAPNSHHISPAQKDKTPTIASEGFFNTGGSGEIRTRDQRIKRHKIVLKQ